MTGALVVIAKNSPVQPMIAVLFQVAFLLVVVKLSPYDSSDDDLSSFVTSLTVLLMTLGAVMISIDTDSETASASDAEKLFASIIMVGLPSSCVAFEIFIGMLNTNQGAKFRARLEKRCKSKLNHGGRDAQATRSNWKVVPEKDAAKRKKQEAAMARSLQEVRMKFGADSEEYKAELKAAVVESA